jgi:hypothetical protein
MASRAKVSKEEMKEFTSSEKWKIELERLEASSPLCVVILTKTFCCGLLLPVGLEGDVLERWLNTNYFYLSGYCPACKPKALSAQWSITHYDDAQIIWNDHGLKPSLDEDGETLLH